MTIVWQGLKIQDLFSERAVVLVAGQGFEDSGASAWR
jgi:hypothetical protein